MYTIKKCNSGNKLHFNKKKNLNLMKLQLPFEILARTPGMLITDVDNIQVNIYKNGDLLIRSDDPKPIAEKVIPYLE